MIARVEIASTVLDSRAQVLKKRLQNLDLSQTISDISIIDVYTIEKDLTAAHLDKIGEMLINPVVQAFTIRGMKDGERHEALGNSTNHAGLADPIASSLLPNTSLNWAIEYGFLPGVTDNVANTAKESIEDLLKTKFTDEEGVYFSQTVLIGGLLSQEDINKITDTLINPLIQRIDVKNSREYQKDGGMDFVVPKVNLGIDKTEVVVNEVDLNVDDEQLLQIGKSGIKNIDGTRRGPLALSLEYMKAIQAYFKKLERNPTDIELESIAQTWSEHCKHTIFADPIDDVTSGLYKAYIKKATEVIRKDKSLTGEDFCVSVFSDNSGAIEFDDQYLVTHKVETHNSPSALDPFGGAITGIVGVNRDAIGFGMGAKPVANTYGFCVADPFDKKVLYKDQKLSTKMLTPRRIIDGVIAGVNAGGNTSGIPTPQGFVIFDESFKGKPLIFVGTVGLIPKTVAGKKSWEKSAKVGDYIVMVGGRVGVDGIHGATFSSTTLDAGSPATAVQIGDPITQKKLSDAIVKEARDLGLYSSITDNGAGGLSCSIAEMGQESGGAQVNLELVPLKYHGLKPWEIWISESQERMTLAVPKTKWKKFKNLMQRRGVEATIIGKFTDSGKCVVRYNTQTIMNIEMEFLHNGLPKRHRITEELKYVGNEPDINSSTNLTTDLISILQRPGITSFEFISSQYDHEVQSSSVLKPLQGKGRVNADTSVIRPILDSQKGVVLSQALYPTYGLIDPYKMAAACIDTAIRNCVAAGGNPKNLALLDNFCWCSSNDPKRLWQLKQSVKACFDTATGFGTPFISGKDSMFNDFSGFDDTGSPVKISVLPTLLISSISVIEDIKRVVSMDVKLPGDLLYLLGETFDEMGGCEYYNYLSDKLGGRLAGNVVPIVDAHKNKRMYLSYYLAVQNQLVSSAVSLGRGGIAVGLVKSLLAGGLGAKVSLKGLQGKSSRDDLALFSESQGRILVTISPKNQKEFENTFKDLAFTKLGIVDDSEKVLVKGLQEKVVIDTDLKSLMEAYKGTFRDF